MHRLGQLAHLFEPAPARDLPASPVALASPDTPSVRSAGFSRYPSPSPAPPEPLPAKAF